MIIRSFRTTRISPLAMLVVASACAWVISKSISYSVVSANGMPLYDAVIHLISVVPDWAGVAIGCLLFTSQALYFNWMLNKHEVLYKPSWLPALLFVLLAGLLPPFLWIHPVLFVHSIVLFAFDRIFSLYKNPQPLAPTFDSAFLLAVAALFYFPAVIFFLFYFVCLLILRPFSWREWMVGAMGLTMPFFLAFLYYFLNDQLDEFYTRVFVTGIKREIDLTHFFTVQYLPSIILVAGVFVLSILKLQTNYFRNITKARLIQQLFIVMVPFCLVSVAVSPDERLFRFNTLAIPLAVYLAYYFLSGKKMWWLETLFLLLVAGWFYNFFIV